MRPAALPLLFGRSSRRIHCLGVGGAGMAPLAMYLAGSGFTVSGEDDDLAPEVAAFLAQAGVAVTRLPAECDVIVHSSAIAPTHPVYLAATARQLPLVRRGEMLAEILRGRRLVAVCGAHGKTTTTAMLITALRRANFPAGYLLGGLFGDGTPPARVGSNDWVVAEIDESDGTIARFSPDITVAVNLDWDHPDFYRHPGEFEEVFAALFERTHSAVLVSDACARSLTLAGAPRAAATWTFGRSGDFAGTAGEEKAGRQALRLSGKFLLAEASVQALGEFNAANATAALGAVQLMGVASDSSALADYPGVRRRQVVLAAGTDGPTLIEDYAHHPTEIRALLGSLRRRVGPGGRLIVVFQPHRFSRTAQFKSEFAAALALADRIHLLDVYAAGEAPIAGGTTADIYAEMKRNTGALPVDYLPGGGSELFRTLTREARRGDIVAFVGAGDIDRQARAWQSQLRQEALAAQRWDDFCAALRPRLSAATKLRRDEALARKTTFGVGGPARVYAEPAGTEDLRLMVQAAAVAQMPIYMLGRGSNLIVPDAGVEGMVISLQGEGWERFEPRADGTVWAGAGLRLKNLCGMAAKAGLAGFEFLEGIPGSVGGALRMNAGAMGGWMFDVVEEVELMRADGSIVTLRKSEMHVDYRHCAELQQAYALGALLRPASAGASEAVSRQIDTYRRKRLESQPRERSAGCIFKNPPGDSAGRLIDASGLKGERVGDAEVSSVHANFIINRGEATSTDVLELIRRVRARVRQASGVDLQPEVLLYGEQWKDVL